MRISSASPPPHAVVSNPTPAAVAPISTLTPTTAKPEPQRTDATGALIKPGDLSQKTSLSQAALDPSSTGLRFSVRRQPIKALAQSSGQNSTSTAPSNLAKAESNIRGESLTFSNQKNSTVELSSALLQFLKKSGPRFFQHRPAELKAAADSLRPLQGKAKFSRHEQLILIDASLMLGKISPATLAKNKSITYLIDQVDSFIDPAGELHQTLTQSAAQLEHRAETPSFANYLRENHPEMITAGDSTSEPQLTSKGREHYRYLKQNFDATALDRHVIPASGQRLSVRDAAVTKLIESGYRDYQSALRSPDDSMKTRRALLECTEIVAQLAKAKPEEVKKNRIATVFPGGVSDPSQLEPGKTYKEDGFVFVGGERASDQGHHMTIKMTKGYSVDARKYYGHSMDNEKKLQWISLPGAQFRFDGVSEVNSKKTYVFSQISR